MIRLCRGRFCFFICQWVVCSFFFFQAEDGIRDLYVTGVQTCASSDLDCVGGDAVFRSSCAVCNAASTRPCAGFLGDFCTSDADCATGLVCRADALGRKICTTTCTVTASGDDCFPKLGTGGLPFSSYAEIFPLGRQLICAAGYCTWQ